MVAAVPRKRSGNRRCVSWLEGTGCGGAASFSFGEGPARAEVSAGQWLLPFLGNGPGTGGVFLGRRGRAAAGRRASFSGRGGFGHVSRRHRYSLLSPAACVSAPRRLPPLAARYLRHRCLSPLSLSAFPPLPPAACLLPPSPACHHPLLPAPPPLLTRRYRPPQQLPATPATLRNLPPPAACHFRRHAPAGRTDGLRRHPAWSVGARCVAGEKFCEIIWKIGKSFLSLFRLSIGVLAFRGRDSCFLLDYHSYGKRDYLSDGGRVQEAQGRA